MTRTYFDERTFDQLRREALSCHRIDAARYKLTKNLLAALLRVQLEHGLLADLKLKAEGKL